MENGDYEPEKGQAYVLGEELDWMVELKRWKKLLNCCSRIIKKTYALYILSNCHFIVSDKFYFQFIIKGEYKL